MWRRIGHLLLAFASMLVAGGWWITLVELWPADSRPYVGGSQTNSILELTLGYNGLGRLTGNEVGSVGGGEMAGAHPGRLRMLGSEAGTQIALAVASGPDPARRGSRGSAAERRVPTAARAGLVLWGTWLLVTGLTFSFMAGIFHAYYSVALAPADRRCHRHRLLICCGRIARRRPLLSSSQPRWR